MFPWGWRQRRLDILGSSGVSAELYLKPGAEPSQGHAYAAGREMSGAVLFFAGAGAKLRGMCPSHSMHSIPLPLLSPGMVL